MPDFDRDRSERRTGNELRRWLLLHRKRWNDELERAGFQAGRIRKSFLTEEEEALAAVLLLRMLDDATASLRDEAKALGLPSAERRALQSSAGDLLTERIRGESARVARGMISDTRSSLAGLGRDLRDDVARNRKLSTLFGRTRADGVAITQTTAAKSAGQRVVSAAAGNVDIELEEYWLTERDARVCPICRPLHRTLREVWGGRFPSGPPAHPRCRCDIQLRRKPGTG